jgi:hypothetical protein
LLKQIPSVALARDDIGVRLAIAWRATRDPDLLWSLTPATPDGWGALGDFAARKHLEGMAADAYERLVGRWPGRQLAERFLSIERPQRAIDLLAGRERDPSDYLVLCRAYREIRDWNHAIEEARQIWYSSPWVGDITRPKSPSGSGLVGPNQMALEFSSAKPIKLQAAEQLNLLDAKGLDFKPAYAAVQELAGQFPLSLRLKWLVYRATRDRGDLESAAGLAQELAEMVIRREIDQHVKTILMINSAGKGED